MYCSTCGSQVVAGRTTCQNCGAAVVRVPQYNQPQQPLGPHGYATVRAVQQPQPAYMGEQMAICPRCAYRGQSISYFSRGGHVAALVGLTVLTAGAMGVGGIAYYLMRRDHRVCPRCGEGWGKLGVRSVAMSPMGANVRLPMQAQDNVSLEPGSARGGWAKVLFVIAAFFTIIALAATEFVPLLFAGMALGGGLLLQRGAREERERKREALIQQLQLPVLQLASKHGGRLTVTQVATEMGWPMTRAEKVLNSLDDGFRVMSDITDDGVIVYDFPELRSAAELRASPQAPSLPPRAQPGPQGNTLPA
jgi:hypothetical protein